MLLAPATRLLAIALLASALGCAPCPAGQAECGNSCVDVQTSQTNCGACGKACGPVQHCEAGACVDGCATGKTQCGNACADLNFDTQNCGSCGNACPATQYCANALCHSRSGSCPYLFLQQGSEYRYHTDLSGSPLAYGLNFFRPGYYGTNIYELGSWSDDHGVYRMKLRELIFEASYFDEAALVIADVPEGYQIFNEWSSTSQIDRAPSLRFFTVKDPRPPRTAISQRGENVVEQISRADGVPSPVGPDEIPQVVLDFGPLEHPERARLVITAWGVYSDFRKGQKPPFSAGTTIEIPDGKGGWREKLVSGKTASDARTWIIDLAGVLESHDSRMRLTLSHMPSAIDVLDSVLIDDSQQVGFQLTRLEPRRADLAFRGASQVQAGTLEHRLTAQDVTRPVDFPDAFVGGHYTRYGDVLPLLALADDRFVLMAQGDELSMEFDAPPQDPGTTRRVFMLADVFYTFKYHPYGILTDKLEPLPYHGMPSYPYPEKLYPYRFDRSYAKYREEWNTREIRLPPPAENY